MNLNTISIEQANPINLFVDKIASQEIECIDNEAVKLYTLAKSVPSNGQIMSFQNQVGQWVNYSGNPSYCGFFYNKDYFYQVDGNSTKILNFYQSLTTSDLTLSPQGDTDGFTTITFSNGGRYIFTFNCPVRSDLDAISPYEIFININGVRYIPSIVSNIIDNSQYRLAEYFSVSSSGIFVVSAGQTVQFGVANLNSPRIFVGSFTGYISKI
jgi:hypothetical protein